MGTPCLDYGAIRTAARRCLAWPERDPLVCLSAVLARRRDSKMGASLPDSALGGVCWIKHGHCRSGFDWIVGAREAVHVVASGQNQSRRVDESPANIQYSIDRGSITAYAEVTKSN